MAAEAKVKANVKKADTKNLKKAGIAKPDQRRVVEGPVMQVFEGSNPVPRINQVNVYEIEEYLREIFMQNPRRHQEFGANDRELSFSMNLCHDA